MSRIGERTEEDGDICTSTLIFSKDKNHDFTFGLGSYQDL